MRKFLWLVSLLAVLLGAVWIAVPYYAAGLMRDALAGQDQLQVRQVRPLRGPLRIGLRLEGVQFHAEGGVLQSDWLELSLSVFAPLRLVADPAASGWLEAGGQRVPYRLEDAGARVTLSALAGLSLSRLELFSGRLVLGEAMLLEGMQAEAQRSPLKDRAPAGAGAAYDVAVRIVDFQPVSFAETGLAVPSLPLLSASGPGRLWLDAAPGPGRGGGAPRLLGLRTGGLQLRIGQLSADLIGHIQQDREGRAEGRVAFYSGDGQGFVDAAIDAGLIPADGRMLIRAMLNQMAVMPMPEGQDGLSFPDPGQGEARVPLVFRGGQFYLGPMPIGPAPRFPGAG